MNKYAILVNYLKTLKKVYVGFSGGVDSTFLLKACKDALGDNVVAVTVCAPWIDKTDTARAFAMARVLNAEHLVINLDFENIPGIKENTKNRCLICKRAIYSAIQSHADIGHILDGSNKDDLSAVRPGKKALEELNILCPLRDFTKSEIRSISKELGLDTFDLESNSCLATRFDYGIALDEKSLNNVSEIEKHLRELGLKNLRARIHKNLVRIETSSMDLALKHSSDITHMILDYGFSFATLDLGGFRSGSMD